jgi:putative transposase
VLLGTDAFVDKMRPMVRDKEKFKEIPRAQRLAHRPALKALFPAGLIRDKPARDHAMRQAHLEYGYSMAAIARAMRLHYSTVGKVIKGER